MFDWIKSLFGKGKIRSEFTTQEGKDGILKINYVGDPNTLDEIELKAHVRNLLLVEYGLHLSTFRVIGFTRD